MDMFQVNVHQQFDNASPLLVAALKGDSTEIANLIKQGQDLNQTDIFGTTALHLASMYGHRDCVELLIQNGAALNVKAYNGYSKNAYTPLDLAILYAPNTDSIEALAQHGAKSFQMNYQLMDLFDHAFEAVSSHQYDDFDLNLAKLEVLGTTLSQAKKIDDSYESVPTGILAEVTLAQGVADPIYYERMLKTVDKLKASDEGLGDKYLLAKDVLHAFPSGQNYTMMVGDFELSVEAEGHFTMFSVLAASNALNAYTQNLSTQNDLLGFNTIKAQFANEVILSDFDVYSLIKKQTFDHVHYAFDTASKAIKMSWQYHVSENLYQDYLAGETILLPTGWTGHAIDIIIDKNYDLLMIANSGERHKSIAPGLNAYHLSYDLTADDIYDIMTNEVQMDLEFKHFYDWGLVEYPEFSFTVPNQEYGNCAWYSQTIAQQALLFLDLQKQQISHDCALALSEQWFKELNDFQQTKILSDYLADPTLEVKALGDILVKHHNQLKNDGELERANLILNTLSKPENRIDFNNYCKTYQKTFSNELKQLVKSYGFKLKNDNDVRVIDMQDVLPDQEVLFAGSNAEEVNLNMPIAPILIVPDLLVLEEIPVLI